MKVVENFQIQLDEKEILRLLSSSKGNRRKKNKGSQILLENIRETMTSSLKLILPKGIYDIVESSTLSPNFLFKKSEQTVLAVCTIGKDLEEKGKQAIKKGELSKGVIIDAIASHAAEQTAEYINKIILEDLVNEIESKEVTCRFSPGYCQWELAEGQRTIFNLIKTEKIGVSLSKSMMMTPVKSVSFAINIGEEVDPDLGTRSCDRCDLVNCVYRRIANM